MKKVLVAMAHPDDELLSVGPLIMEGKDRGLKFIVALVCDNGSRHGKNYSALEACKKMGNEVGFDVETYGIEETNNKSLPLKELITWFEWLDEFNKPDIVISHNYGDLNKDHREVHEAARVAFRYTTFCDGGVLSSTENSLVPFVPNWFIPVKEESVEKTWEMMEKYYYQECAPHPHPRSKESMMAFYKYWGSFILAPYAVPLFLRKGVGGF